MDIKVAIALIVGLLIIAYLYFDLFLKNKHNEAMYEEFLKQYIDLANEIYETKYILKNGEWVQNVVMKEKYKNIWGKN